MSNASGPGPDDPSSRLPPRPPGTPGPADSGSGVGNAAGRNTGGEIGHASESDEDAQPIDPALIAGGEDIVGVANDMTTGQDTMGATTGGERASAGQADGRRSSRDRG
jgi:hypothetical protein